MKNISPALIGLLGVILGISASAFWQWTESEDRYRAMTFESRLEAHQEAFALADKTMRRFYSVRIGVSSIPDKPTLYSYFEELREGWQAYCLYLEPTARGAFYDLMMATAQCWQDYNSENAKKCYDLAEAAEQKLVEGIGQEYLPAAP